MWIQSTPAMSALHLRAEDCRSRPEEPRGDLYALRHLPDGVMFMNLVSDVARSNHQGTKDTKMKSQYALVSWCDPLTR